MKLEVDCSTCSTLHIAQLQLLSAAVKCVECSAAGVRPDVDVCYRQLVPLAVMQFSVQSYDCCHVVQVDARMTGTSVGSLSVSRVYAGKEDDVSSPKFRPIGATVSLCSM